MCRGERSPTPCPKLIPPPWARSVTPVTPEPLPMAQVPWAHPPGKAQQLFFTKEPPYEPGSPLQPGPWVTAARVQGPRQSCRSTGTYSRPEPLFSREPIWVLGSQVGAGARGRDTCGGSRGPACLPAGAGCRAAASAGSPGGSGTASCATDGRPAAPPQCSPPCSRPAAAPARLCS